MTTHGLSYTPEYRVWAEMLQRCNNPNNPRYNDYGGRGIKVCKEWNRFINFYNDMGPRPSNRHSLDRIDNDGDYTPSNCRWATSKQQIYNRRSQKQKEFCSKGHSLIGDNLYFGTRGIGHDLRRLCRICLVAYQEAIKKDRIK